MKIDLLINFTFKVIDRAATALDSYKLGLTISLMLVLSSCLPQPKTNPAASQSGSFYVASAAAQFTQPIFYPSIAVPRGRVLSVTACLRSNQHSRIIDNHTFEVDLGREKKVLVSNGAGCIIWDEEIQFNALAPARNVGLRRVIVARGYETGSSEFELILNPWENQAYTSLNTGVSTYLRGAEAAQALQAGNDYHLRLSVFFGTLLAVDNRRENNYRLGFSGFVDLLSRGQAEDARLTRITRGDFEVQFRVMNRTRAGALTEIRSTDFSPVSIDRDGQLNFTVDLPIDIRTCRYDHVLIGIRLRSKNSDIALEVYEGVFVGPTCNTNSGTLVTRDAEFFNRRQEQPGYTIEQYFENYHQRQTILSQFNPRTYIRPLEFHTITYGGPAHARRRHFRVITDISSAVGHEPFRGEVFQVTRMLGGPPTPITTLPDGKLIWEDFVEFDYYAPECYLLKKVRIQNTGLNIDEEIEILMNPWAEYDGPQTDLRPFFSSGRNSQDRSLISDERALLQAGYLGQSLVGIWQRLRAGERVCGGRASHVTLDSYRFNTTQGFRYHLNDALNLQLTKSGKMGFRFGIQKPLLSEDRTHAVRDALPGHYLFRIAVIDREVLTDTEYRNLTLLIRRDEDRSAEMFQAPLTLNPRPRDHLPHSNQGFQINFDRLRGKIHYFKEEILYLGQVNQFERPIDIQVRTHSRQWANRHLVLIELMPIRPDHQSFLGENSNLDGVELENLLSTDQLYWATFIGKITPTEHDPASNLSLLTLSPPNSPSFLTHVREIYRADEAARAEEFRTSSTLQAFAERNFLKTFNQSARSTFVDDLLFARGRGGSHLLGTGNRAQLQVNPPSPDQMEQEGARNLGPDFQAHTSRMRHEFSTMLSQLLDLGTLTRPAGHSQRFFYQSLCNFWFREYLPRRMLESGASNTAYNRSLNDLMRFCHREAESDPRRLFQVEFHFLPSRVVNHLLHQSDEEIRRRLARQRTLNPNINFRVDYGFDEGFSQNVGAGIDAALKLPFNRARSAGAGADVSFSVKWDTGEGRGQSNSVGWTAGLNLLNETLVIPFSMPSYQKCVSLRLNPGLFINRMSWQNAFISANSLWDLISLGTPQNINRILTQAFSSEASPEQFARLSQGGLLFCDEHLTQSEGRWVEEGFHVINQQLVEGTLTDSQSDLTRLYLQMRGDNDLIRFLSFVVSGEGAPSDFQPEYFANFVARDPFVSAFTRPLPSNPGVITRSTPTPFAAHPYLYRHQPPNQVPAPRTRR